MEESGPGSVDNNSSDPVSTHIDAYHGHPVHKWDQRVLIKRIFHVVDHTHNNGVHQHKKGTITLQQFLECISLITTHNGSYCNCTEIAVERGTSRAFSRSVSRSTARNKLKSRMNMMNATPAPCTENCLSHLLSLLKFTLFGTWLKLKQSHYFELIFDVNGGDNGVALTKKEFLLAAKAAAHEFQVPPCRIRLPDEHKSTCIHEYSMQLVINNQKKNPKDGSGVEDKLLAKYFATLARDHRLSSLSKSAGGLQRVVKVGDIVWSLYGNGVTWFPAIVTSKNDADGTFDLSYPLNTDEFHQMGMELASKEIIDNYKKNNQTFINKTSKKNNIDSSANSNADVVVIPPKCLTDDVAYYKYVFHLIDTVGHDVLDSQLLIDQLRSTAFSDIIKSSLALQMLLSDDGVGNCLFVDLLTCNSQTTEVEFVEVCCTLNEIASYQML